jgi:hypothetical protein
MEFTEQVDLNACDWLLSQLSTEFMKEHVLEGEEDRFNYSHVKKILQNYKKNKGITKVKYFKKDSAGILRDYGEGVQNMPTKFRGLICKHMTDVDMVNCHPVILLNLCEKHKIPCPYLKNYCEHRAECLDKHTTKTLIMKSMNSKFKLKNVSNWMLMFDMEMKQIQQAFIVMPEYEQQKELAKQSNLAKNKKNLEGAFMSNLVTTFEVQILHKCLEYAKVEVGVLMYDGFMFYGQKPDGFLQALSTVALDLGFAIEFKYKDHDHSIKIPEDWQPKDEGKLYETLKQKYEKDYCLAFIEMNVTYSFKVNNKIQFYGPGEIYHQFETEFVGNVNFWKIWSEDPNRQSFRDVGMYPHDAECPDGILNLWEGYAVEKLPHSDADISLMLDHIRTLLKTEELFDFFILWLRNMFQYPSGQSIIIILKSKEGAGKSVIVDFLHHIMGNQHFYECQDVKENLYGIFNAHLSGKVFININEVERRDMMPHMEKLKTMITSPTITIEEKGKKKYEEDNKRHMLITTNHDNPVPIQEGSRRFSYIKCSDELVGNTQYFNELFAFIEKKANQRAFYQYLMETPVKRKLTAVDIPITQDMKNMFEANRDPIEDFAEQFTGKMTAYVNYDNYKQYLRDNGLKFELPKKAFEMKFSDYMEKYGIVSKRETHDNKKETYYSKICLLN